jgi:hypothetical protein
VVNNGTSNGLVTFVVPPKDAQNNYNFPGNNLVGVVSTLPFSQVNGARVSDIGGIDGVTSLEGVTVMFYNTGVSNESGFVSKFYDQTLYDENGGSAPYTYPGSTADYNNYEGGYYTDVNATFYVVNYVGDTANDPTIQLTPIGLIPTEQKITAQFGQQWGNTSFYRNVTGAVQAIPYNSAVLDTLYYQDGTTPNKVGVLRITDNNTTNRIDVIDNILGKPTYTAPNGVVFTNGLKVMLQGNIYPESYRNVQYYVEGVGTAIELIPVQNLVSPGLFSAGSYIPYDTTPYDIGNYDVTLYVTLTPDYITIARNAINKNAWSRSNRWFHIDVITATAEYNNDPTISTTFATQYNKAKRPIIEFYPNIRLFDSGVIGKAPIDFIDFRTTDALTYVAGKSEYYPDVAGYTGYDATIAAVTGTITSKVAIETRALTNVVVLDNTAGLYVNDTIVFGSAIGNIASGTTYYITSVGDGTITISEEKNGSTLVLTAVAPVSVSTVIQPYSTTITVPTTQVFGLFEPNQYIVDSTQLLPTNSQVTLVALSGSNTVITVNWPNISVVTGTSVASVVTADTSLDNYALFEGARVVFAADTSDLIRNKIFISRFSVTTDSDTPVITLTEAEDGLVLPDEQTAVFRGYNYKGQDFYFNGIEWQSGQQKITVNQAPKFDIFDNNGISLGDPAVYVGTSFTGSTLFRYGIGIGTNDLVLGFPLLYSSIDNIGDISFEVSLNSETFNYVQNNTPINQPVNTGYVYNYTARDSFVRQLGWQTAVSPSVQYQIFDFNYRAVTPTNTFVCDIAPVSSTTTRWPTVQVYINNIIQDKVDYTVTTTGTTTTVTIPSIAAVDTVIQILVLSDQVSTTAYYQIPINLANNPFNADITTVNVGDIRRQYQSIFYNNPDTTGEVFGPNNYRDLGNLVPWGNSIIQNSASLALPGAFLRKQDHNLYNSLLFNSRQYINYKTLLVDTVNNTDYNRSTSPAAILDDAVSQITASKIESESFFWSDMLPAKAIYVTNSYSFANSLDVSIYPLSRVYDFSTANYYGVLVYLTRSGVITQLVTGVDYVVSTDTPSLTVNTDLLPNDLITINEYNQTYGSYVPNTPTKLGLYPATIPSITLDAAYNQPTYFIVGHDGSFTKLYGNYDPTTGQLDDYRDQVLLEFETRIYNNLKLSNVIPVQAYEVIPGFFRDTQYSYDEFLQIYSESFLDWVGQNRINYQTQFFNNTNEFSFNYRDSGNKIDRAPINQGYWRGTYLYFYDTSTPNTTPWQLIGYANQPTWWTERYGPAPYTSDNLILWGDLAAGIDWNNGNPIVLPEYIRSELLQVIPVDSAGDVISPFISIVGNYDNNIFRRDWEVGDVGPAEFSYRRSSSWPFDLMRILALTKPAEFYNLAVDVDNYKYNAEFNQYLVNDRSHLVISDVQIYGSGTAKTSYINWIVDYEKQGGVDATNNITNLLSHLDVRLVYRVAGFTDKDMLKFYVEKSSANSNNSSLLIPDESYAVLLYNNQPFDRIIYSGVIIQITNNGYTVFGNSQTNAYFTILEPKINGNSETVVVEKASAKLARDYFDRTITVPYGTEFYNLQEVSQFLASYGSYLIQQGVLFEQAENGVQITWPQMVAEFLYWAQVGWEVGSITTINPAASVLSINKDSYIIQPLTLRNQNFVLNQNLYPIQATDLSVVREGTAFTAQPLNQGDTVAYAQFNVSNFENGIVFDNITLFNDLLYNLTTGLRQSRIALRGTKTADWTGVVDAYGFILNQDNVIEWSKDTKYTTGSIVRFKNRYWTALTIIQAKALFDERDWKETKYNEIQKGLLANSSTRSYESTLYYDTNKANLENDADLLSFSLIGYRPRDYLATADLTDVTQVNVYKNMIKLKGTLDAASAFKGANLAQGGINYDIYENWAIKSGEFGGILSSNFIEMRLNQPLLTGNPSTVALTNGGSTPGVEQEVPVYSLFNYSTPVTDPNILSVIPTNTPSTLYPSAGYVNYNDVKMASYYYSGLPTAQNAYGTVVPISEFYVRDYVWLANYLEEWKVYTPASLGTVVGAKNNLNGTVTITFAQPHTLTKFQLFAIVNFDVTIDNYYLVAAVIDPFRVIINLSLAPNTLTVVGTGVAFRMQNQRVSVVGEIPNLPLLDNEFNKLKVWVDENSDGGWAVYRKSLNYKYDSEITKTSSDSFGSAVAYANALGYLIGDSGLGEVYRYTYDTTTNSYLTHETITKDVSFGSYISYADNFYVISEPDSASPKVYIYEFANTGVLNELVEYQVIEQPSIPGWGSATAISGDKNWIYISDIINNTVYVYRKSAITGQYEEQTTLTVSGLTSGDNFGYSISIDYYGDTVVISAPGQDSGSLDNYGYVYVFDRTVQSFDSAFTSNVFIPLTFQLAWTPDNVTQTATATASGTNRITVGLSTGFSIGDPVVFSGTLLSAGALAENTVYYVKTKPTTSTLTVSLTRGGDTVVLENDSGSMVVTVQTEPLFVTINGTSIDDNQYAVIGSTLYTYSIGTPILNAGDILQVVSSHNFVLAQTLDNGMTPRTGVQFGNSVATNTYANEILVGAPFELDADNHEGAVHRFTNGGEKYGIIIGIAACATTTDRIILLNGYQVTLPAGDATVCASAINGANIVNVSATTLGDKLVIQLVNMSLAVANRKLSLTILNAATLLELGIATYTETQKIECPHTSGPTQFGHTIKFSQSGSFIASAPTGTRFSATTFDFTDDELDNDTVFDNNATSWIDPFVNAGAVYMFDFLPAYQESLTNPGAFVYAQSTNAENLTYGAQPNFGYALDFNENRVTIGTPDFRPNYVNGQVVTYINASGVQDWAVYRSSAPIVDINGIANIQLFSANTNTTLDNLDYFDPLQGKLLGAVVENLDVVSNNDPAGYNSPNNQGGIVWGIESVGKIWFNTSNVRFLNYHQNDVVYNSKYWGRVFPGSDVAVYSWIASNVPPAQYSGPGTAYSLDNYTVRGVINAAGSIVPIYYFWARNTNIIFTEVGKTLADSTIQSYIAQPQASGISYLAPILPNAFALYNVGEYLNGTGLDTVLHVGYSTGVNHDNAHNQYALIKTNFADDFLPGLPDPLSFNGTRILQQPSSLYRKMIDSLGGVDDSGAVIPDPFLPIPVRSGVLSRPRQSFFNDRFGALQNYLEYYNSILKELLFFEITNESTLFYASGEFFNVPDYWESINWWAPGYNDNTKSSIQVPIYADLATLAVPYGTIVTVLANGMNQMTETYVYESIGIWNRIGLTNGTIQLKSSLWDYAAAGFGFGNNFFDTAPYDIYPSEETKLIVRALNEELPADILIYRNRALILLFEYIQSESSESQNYLPWLNKTSFIDVSHTIRELLPLEVFRSDNQVFLSGYINEVKPYHVVIKDFLFKYTRTDVFEGDITDFDLPAQYNTSVQQFITPELVYTFPENYNQYLPTDPIWQSPAYNQWFKNHGVAIVGQNDYPIAILESYMALNTDSIYVNNAYGFPVTGVIQVGNPAVGQNPSTFETIGYSNVDLVNSRLTGLTRGVDGSTIQAHLPGEKIIIDLPAVLVLNSGRAYQNPPRVLAYIDTLIYPAPTVPAQLEAIMALDEVIGVTVINPGQGYAVLPTIVIDPAFIVEVGSLQVDVYSDTVELIIPSFETGDLIVYQPTVGSTKIGGLLPGQKYYVGLLESYPSPIIAFYDNYLNAIYDSNRIPLISAGTGTQTFRLGAIASCITTSTPVRENNITLRFDRTSYASQVIDWVPGNFYGSFYAGSYSDRNRVSSSSISTTSTQPPIVNPYDIPLIDAPDTILASAADAIFAVLDVTNDQVLTWSSRTRNVVQTYAYDYYISAYQNAIRISPSEGGSPVEGDLGSTIGFYVGMPVKFTGSTTGTGLAVDTTYYVRTLVQLPNPDTAVLEDTGFTLQDANGTAIDINTATASPAGLTQYVGEVVDTAIMTINYSGLRNASATTSVTNTITVDLTVTGENGTNGFYTGMPLFFTGEVFGGIVENEPYVVTSVVDIQTFTMAKANSPAPIQVEITATAASGNVITGASLLGVSINDPVIFTGITFGNIVAGTTYYIREILTNYTFTIAETVNGNAFVLSNDSGTCTMTDQTDTLSLTDATGSMTLNVIIPVSPGQITGQQFTLYNTSEQYSGLSGTNSGELSRTITATLATVNRVCISTFSGGTTNFYSGMEFNVDSNIGGLTTSGGPYTVTSIGTTSITVTNTSSTGNKLTCTSTDVLYAGMPLYFSGISIGLVRLGIVYYVSTITSPTQFTISESVGGTIYTLTTENGTMVGTGEQYIELASPSLSSVTDEVTLTQESGSSALFSVSSALGGYYVIIENSGSGYAIGNKITILGNLIGGVVTTNNLVMTIADIDSGGEITQVIAVGAPAGVVTDYYLRVISVNQMAVYSNSLMTIPVSGIDFPYVGATTTTATVATASNNRFTVTSSTDFALNDPVVFTGTVFGGIELGQTYYVKAKPTTTTVTISEVINGTVFDILTDSTGTMTIAKSGSYAVLPEPFYFNNSIVKFNNRVYQCIISNNDAEFIFGKWELLVSGDSKLNELDRIIGYYQPTVNMPGVDLTQLIEGIRYPNSSYLGNAFAPAKDFPLDTILTDQPFYPTGVNCVAVVWNGAMYFNAANTETYSAILTSADTNAWVINKITNVPISMTDIIYAGEKFVITSTNNATPILTSDDGYIWTTYISSTQLSLNSIAYHNGIYVAVGKNIVTSVDLTTWTETYNFGNSLDNTLYNVSWVSTAGFTGFMAVGLGEVVVGSTTEYVAIVRTSTDGYVWTEATNLNTSSSLNSVVGNGSVIVVVGNDGIVYNSFNSLVWFIQATATSENLNRVIWENDLFIAVGDNGVLQTSPDGQTWTLGSTGTTNDLQDILWNADLSEYLAVGTDSTILRSTDLITWEEKAAFVVTPTAYDVQGDPFESGYGPEEMVPGLVQDSITMTVATRPGTNWDVTVYQHAGYNVVSTEIFPESSIQVEYSFANIVITPVQLSVFVVDFTTGVSTAIYNEIDYTIDWVNKSIILNDPIYFLTPGTSDTLVIDVYEVGNGNQLVKSSSDAYPIRENTTTGFQEIYLNANYVAGIWQGSGVVRPTTEPVEATAIATSALTNAITCDTVKHFILNSPISFNGAVFGGIVEEQVYYVKSISYVSNRITISDTYNIVSGTAGATLQLTTGTGLMTAIIQSGTGTPWTPPIVFHNGSKLVLGVSSYVTRTRASRDTITCNTTGTLIPGQPIKFSDTMFGGVIVPQQIYYVKTIYDTNEFTISETQYGSLLELTEAFGGATFVTNDYSIGLAPNGITASVIFAAQYDITEDYLAYSFFGETMPAQYGFTVPLTEVFVGDGATSYFALDSYVGDANPQNAIVEVSGLRQTESAYTIDPMTNSILFNSPPAVDASVAITTYNLTDNQYLNTQYGVTGSGGILTTINVSDTTHQTSTYDQDTPTVATYDEDTPSIVSYDEVLDWLTLGAGDTSTLIINSPVIFSAPTIGGITAGKIYYIASIINSTDFTISITVGGAPLTVTTDSGSMDGTINGLTVAGIVNIANAIAPPIAVISVSATFSGVNFVVCADTAGLIVGQNIIFKAPIFAAGTFTLADQYQITTLGDTDWNTVAGTLGITYAVGDIITANDVGSGTGYALLANVGGIDTTGQVYFVRAIASSIDFTIEDQFGTLITLTNAISNIVGFLGGLPAVRVTTGIAHNLTENALVRIDGVIGSTQLNNNTYYAKIITDTIVDLYTAPYNPALNAVNYPVTLVSSYVSGGYIWLNALFTVALTTATATSSVMNRITCNSIEGLIPGTPVYFTELNMVLGDDILGNILADTEYYVLEVAPEVNAEYVIVGNLYGISGLGDTDWNIVAGTSLVTYAVGDIITAAAADPGTTGTANGLQEFTISEQRYPNEAEFVLATATGNVNVSQFQQVNVDRLWVTVNGYRVPSSKLKINLYNNLSILTEMTTGDIVTITSMMPTATPNEQVYQLNVNTSNEAAVYRAETQTRTWLVQPLYNTQDIIYLNDASRITDTITQVVTLSAPINGIYSAGLTANKNTICHISVYNNTTSTLLDADYYYVEIEDLAPILKITDGVSTGDSVTINTVIGRVLFINGEYIGFAECNLADNTVTMLSRGINGTGEQTYHPLYSEVFGLIPTNRMSDVNYAKTWNSYIYNPIYGDPLQISQTSGANFLRVDIT